MTPAIPDPASGLLLKALLDKALGRQDKTPAEVTADEQRFAPGVQARVSRHNQNLPPEERASQYNQDWDHYLVGQEMAGPQNPIWTRVGAILPAVGHEAMRPAIAQSPALVNALNKVFGTPDEPVWIAQGAGAGGAAAEPTPTMEQSLRNLLMLYRGATEGTTPSEERGYSGNSH
jgi:hypothetical protein